MKISVIGAGAIGGLIAGYLREKDQDVILIAKPEQTSALSTSGLRVKGVRGDKNIFVSVSDRLEQKCDLVILAIKTQDLAQVLAQNQPLLSDKFILTTQNGLAADRIVAEQCPPAVRFSSIVMFGATHLSPGEIVHNFEGQWIMGADRDEDFELLKKYEPILSKAFPCVLTRDIAAMKWLKLFLNANNCLPAVLGKSMQETFGDLYNCKISLQLWREGWELLQHAGISVTDLPDFPSERIVKLISMPADASAGIFSNIMTQLSAEPLYGSILQSIKRGRPSEIDFINGEFVKLAESLGQKAPLNERMVQMVHTVERNNQFFNEEQLLRFTRELVDKNG